MTAPDRPDPTEAARWVRDLIAAGKLGEADTFLAHMVHRGVHPHVLAVELMRLDPP